MVDMNNKYSYLIQPLISAALVLLVLFIFQKFTTGSFTNAPKRIFEVQGTGTVTVTPKTVQTDFTIHETGTTQADAQQKGNDKQNQATDLLTKLGFLKKDIKTINYNVSPNYDNSVPNIMMYPPRPQGNSQNGYVINIDTQIQTDDVNRINKAIDQLTALGTNVSGVSYNSSPTDTNKYKDEARAKAIADAREKAMSMAKAAGFTMGEISTIKDLDNTPIAYPMMKGIAGGVSQDTSAPTNIQPGSNDVTSSVSITYYIQ